MSFQWAGLADTPDGVREQEAPPHAVRRRSSIDVIGFDKYNISTHEDGTILVSTVLTERFTGAIEGVGIADHIRILRADGSGVSTGIERIEGTVDGRRGSFILTAFGRNHSAREVSGTWTVQPGSGTAELTGIRGRGSYTAVADADWRWHAEDEFVWWFDLS